MELIIGRNSELYHGFSVSDAAGNTLLRIDGKKDDLVPVLLLTLDSHTLYGLSHPKVISRILSTGPHVLIAQKKLAHSLYEHGMKSCWGNIKILNNKFQTTIDTFYEVKFQESIAVSGHQLVVTSWISEESSYATLVYKNQVYVLSSIDVKPSTMTHSDRFINISSIKDYIKLEFDDTEISAIDNSGTGGIKL